MKALLTGTTGSAITAGTTQYQPFMTQASTNSWSSSLTAATQTPMPHALTLDMLRVKVATAPGVGKNLVIVVLKNGTASALTCTISGTNTTAQDLTHTVSYAAGDTITLQATLDTGGTAFGTIYWTARQDATGMFAMIGAITSASAGFYPVMGSIGSAGTSGDTGVIMPCAGTIQNIYVNSSASAGNFTVYLNAVAQTITTGVMGAATANDTTHSFSVAAGDRVLVRNTGTARVSSWGVSFLPTTDGQSFVGAVSNGNVSTASTTYLPTVNVSGSPSTTESWGMLQACTLLGLFAQTSVSPGVSPKAYTFTARDNSTNTAATFAINDASSTPNDATSGRANNITGQSIAISDDDLLSTSIAPASTPIGLHVYVSMLISMSSGGTAYTSSLTAALSFTGAMQKQTNYPLAAGASFTGAIARAIAHLQSGTLSSTGGLTKQTNHVLPAAAVSFSGNVVKITGKNLVATITFSGAISRAIRHVFTAGVSFTGAMARTVRRSLAAALSFAGAIAKSTNRALTGVLSFTGTITKGAIHFLSLAGTLSFTGVFNKNTQKNIGGVLSETGLMQRSTQRSLTANTTFTGSIARRTARALTATITFAGAFTKGAFHAMALTATVAFNGVFARSTNKGFMATTTPAGTVSRRTNRAFSAVMSYTGAISKRVGRPLAATLSYTGSITRRAGRSLVATMSYTGAIAKQAQRKLTGTMGYSGAISKRTGHNMSASATPSGQIKRNIKKTLTGAVSYSGSIARTTLRALTASMGFVGNLVARLMHILRSTPTRPIYLGQKNERLGIGQKPSITELGQGNNNTHLNQNPQTRTTDDNNDDSLLPM